MNPKIEEIIVEEDVHKHKRENIVESAVGIKTFRIHIGSGYRASQSNHLRHYYYVMGVDAGTKLVSASVTEGHHGDAKFHTLGVEFSPTTNQVRIGFEISWSKNTGLQAYADVLMVK